jgi:hypothetical protein
MKIRFAAIALCLLPAIARAQDKPQPKSVTIPAVIDHNRILIEVEVAGQNGGMEHVQAWVDNGNPDFELSRHLATQLGLKVSCSEIECTSALPPAISVGGIQLSLADVKGTHIPLKPVNAASVLAAGLPAEINIPSTILRHYDVLIDFPGRKFTIGTPGAVHFQGPSAKAQVNAANGLIQVPSQIENKKYNLALDLGSSISFLSGELFDKLQAAHPDLPHMTGAVGSANVWGQDDEPKWKVMRLDRVQYGPLFLTNVAVVEFPKGREELFEKRAAIPTAGLLGSQALLNYRVGLDYAHAMVYFDIGRMFTFPDFDVVGMTLRPEDNGQFSILGIAEFDGKPSVPTGTDGVQPGDHLIAVNDISVQGLTMGQVWKMLGGSPEQERRLTIERGGKQLAIAATVQHFLGENPDNDPKKKR